MCSILRRRSALLGYLNLGVLILSGVVVSYWCLWHTDWFDAIAQILALGGGFTWLAVVLKLLPDERIKQLKDRIQLGLDSWLMTGLLLSVVILWLAWASFFGAIRVELVQDVSDRLISIHPVGEPARDDEVQRLSPGQKLQKLVLTYPFSNKEFLVSVAGYPTKHVRVGSWGVESLRIPFAFRVPTILLHPSPELSHQLRNSPKKLLVFAGTEQGTLPDYSGQAVWIGCDEDVEVPTAIQLKWRDHLTEADRPLMSQWLPPKTVVLNSELREGELVTVRVENVTNSISIKVKALHPPNYLPQEVEIDATLFN